MRRFPGVLLSAAIGMLVATTVARADAGPNGAAIYKSKCAMCHGPDGKGQTKVGKSLKVRDLSSPEVQKLSNAQLQKIICEGKGKMPAYKSKLDQPSIDAVIGIIRQFGSGH